MSTAPTVPTTWEGTMTIDPAKLEATFGRVVTDLAAAFTVRMVRIGDRLGIYRAMSESGAVTVSGLAAKVGCNERYLTEWLAQQVASEYVTHDATADTYALSEEFAAILADETSPTFLAGMAQVLASTYTDEPTLTAAFSSGAGVGWGEHHHDLFDGTLRLFRPGYAANLVDSWLPALNGVVDALRAGSRVVDVGCGHGASTILMAEAFPASTFLGIDPHPDSVEAARKAAANAGVADRVRFEVDTATTYTDTADLVTLFDCLHDMGDPVGALTHIRSTLSPDGVVMAVEPMAGDQLADNINPVGQIFYAASTMICTPASRSQDVGLALGAQAGEARLRAVAQEAGFTHVRRAAETPVNLVLEIR
jgi:SAM-dependent methyltransferase